MERLLRRNPCTNDIVRLLCRHTAPTKIPTNATSLRWRAPRHRAGPRSIARAGLSGRRVCVYCIQCQRLSTTTRKGRDMAGPGVSPPDVRLLHLPSAGELCLPKNTHVVKPAAAVVAAAVPAAKKVFHQRRRFQPNRLYHVVYQRLPGRSVSVILRTHLGRTSTNSRMSYRNE